jgi:hypothetical protein
VKLIKRNIDALPTPDKRHYVYDDELSGFALSVLPTGRKTFVAHYRLGGGLDRPPSSGPSRLLVHHQL